VLNEEIGCLVFIVSSHGCEKEVDATAQVPKHMEHYILCSDGQMIMTKEIIDMFHTDYIRKVVPKLFIIQVHIFFS